MSRNGTPRVFMLEEIAKIAITFAEIESYSQVDFGGKLWPRALWIFTAKRYIDGDHDAFDR